MLEVVSTVRSPSKADHHHHHNHGGGFDDVFMVDDDNLLDYIDFTSCVDVPFFDSDGDILPDLEVDPTELLAEFDDACPRTAHAEAKPPADDGEKKEESPAGGQEFDKDEKKDVARKKKTDEVSSAVTTEDSAAAAGSDTKSSASAEGQSKKKTSSAGGGSKNSHGKRKVKVDWTPELHRRFVQAVEQLGIDKAVPSRILEIMGIECLTRHNIASHLQKYRSHRKHLMAREAEAATWAQKRQMYAAAAAAGAPRMVPPPPGFVRPLHVWGHPPISSGVEPGMLPVWPRHLPPRPWQAARKWGPQPVTQGMPCVTPPMPTAATTLPRFPVPGMMPHPMYRPMQPPPPQSSKQIAATLQQLQLDAHPSKESIDAAIGDVLVKPWLPLPLGLKPPSLDSVMSELHKQGIPKIPPAATT
ncbi:hypothetical protein EJB05_32807 [Eragrostis curvula]|uniref:HTH myb-type domain-containing protein n=1 Tax=Eragrostis curvula TaxID=38414 RepID=A0A5J9UHD0_9POAL|nr:hypothetical protein EJB05_32807 [Eragrostis curvula]